MTGEIPYRDHIRGKGHAKSVAQYRTGKATDCVLCMIKTTEYKALVSHVISARHRERAGLRPFTQEQKVGYMEQCKIPEDDVTWRFGRTPFPDFREGTSSGSPSAASARTPLAHDFRMKLTVIDSEYNTMGDYPIYKRPLVTPPLEPLKPNETRPRGRTMTPKETSPTNPSKDKGSMKSPTNSLPLLTSSMSKEGRNGLSRKQYEDRVADQEVANINQPSVPLVSPTNSNTSQATVHSSGRNTRRNLQAKLRKQHRKELSENKVLQAVRSTLPQSTTSPISCYPPHAESTSLQTHLQPGGNPGLKSWHKRVLAKFGGVATWSHITKAWNVKEVNELTTPRIPSRNTIKSPMTMASIMTTTNLHPIAYRSTTATTTEQPLEDMTRTQEDKDTLTALVGKACEVYDPIVVARIMASTKDIHPVTRRWYQTVMWDEMIYGGLARQYNLTRYSEAISEAKNADPSLGLIIGLEELPDHIADRIEGFHADKTEQVRTMQLQPANLMVSRQIMSALTKLSLKASAMAAVAGTLAFAASIPLATVMAVMPVTRPMLQPALSALAYVSRKAMVVSIISAATTLAVSLARYLV